MNAFDSEVVTVILFFVLPLFKTILSNSHSLSKSSFQSINFETKHIINNLDLPDFLNKDSEVTVLQVPISMYRAGKLFVGLRTLCSGFLGTHKIHDTRLQWLSDLVEDLNDRVVIFYNLNVERDAIIELLTKLEIPYSEYNGRCKDLRVFKNNQNGVAVCQYMSASTGLNDLVCSHICVMYSLPLNYIDYRQAQKRIDRIGQTVKPLYYNLYCKGTVEEKIYDALKQGMSFDDEMFDYYMNNS